MCPKKRNSRYRYPLPKSTWTPPPKILVTPEMLNAFRELQRADARCHCTGNSHEPAGGRGRRRAT
jgi:hypothetical protein